MNNHQSTNQRVKISELETRIQYEKENSNRFANRLEKVEEECDNLVSQLNTLTIEMQIKDNTIEHLGAINEYCFLFVFKVIFF
jgi:hypothetical protein